MNYSDLVSDIMPEVLGCPSVTIKRAVRDSVIEFFERSMAYKVENDPAKLPKNVQEIDLELPTKTRLVKVLTVRYGGAELQPVTREDMDRLGYDWPTLTGTPQGYTFATPTSIRLVPYPSDSTATKAYVRFAVAPTRVSTSLPDELGERYYEAICAGVKFRLMRMPKMAWTDANLAAFNGSQFEKGINKARLDSAHDNVRAVRRVVMRRV